MTYQSRSQRGEAATAFLRWLADTAGHDAQVLPHVQCPERFPALRFVFMDRGDLLVGKHMIQVKWPTIAWRDRGSFPHEAMIIDEWHKAQRSASQGCVAYWILSADLTCVCVFRMTDQRKLYKQKLFNSNQDHQRHIEYAMSPLDCLEWIPIDRELLSLALQFGIINPAWVTADGRF